MITIDWIDGDNFNDAGLANRLTHLSEGRAFEEKKREIALDGRQAGNGVEATASVDALDGMENRVERKFCDEYGLAKLPGLGE